MIDEMIPNLSHPMLRALYNALLGRREPTPQEMSVLIGVGARMREATDLMSPEVVTQIEHILERALRIDKQGVSDRIEGYCKELGQCRDERTAKG